MTQTARAADAPKFPGAIDAHVHVWTPDTERYPLAEGFKKENMKPASFTPEELLALARPAGVERIVLIQMSFYRFDNSYMLDTMRRFPGVFSGVGIVDSTVPHPDVAMGKLAEQGVRGFRITPRQQSGDDGLESAGLQVMWGYAAKQGLAICPLVGPHNLPSIDRMCDKFPETTVVIDHCARIGTSGTIEAKDVDFLCGMARHKKLHVKVSAFYALSPKGPPYDDLAPMIRRLCEAFTPSRLMWASDCPFQVKPGHTYGESIALIRDRLDFLSASERDAILCNTAERVFFAP
ncbi:MAG: amidohydrolase family protein [Planctomycetes bacterium]|nr:amidohydrolase family protein [Planctomycetota bacterium]